MLTPEIKTQVEVVLKARRIEDHAYRDVMAITKSLSVAEIDQLAEIHKQAARLTDYEEAYLVKLTIEAMEAIPS